MCKFCKVHNPTAPDHRINNCQAQNPGHLHYLLFLAWQAQAKAQAQCRPQISQGGAATSQVLQFPLGIVQGGGFVHGGFLPGKLVVYRI